MSNIYPLNPLNSGNPYLFNPYNSVPQVINPISQPIPQVAGPHMEIGRVDSKEAIYSIPMGPNSSALFADNNIAKIWMVTTDQSGFKKITGLSYTVDQEEVPQVTQPQQNDDLLERLSKRLDDLEERMNSNGQSNFKPAYAKQPGNGNNRPNGRGGPVGQESGNES